MENRTKITPNLGGVKIAFPKDLDKSWRQLKEKYDTISFKRELLADKRDSIRFQLGNEIVEAKDRTTLNKLKGQVIRLENIHLSLKYENQTELVCKDNLGNEIWLKSGETKTFEEIDREYQLLKLSIESRLEYVEDFAPPKTFDLSDGELLEQLKPYFQNCSFTDLETIILHKQLPIGRVKILWDGAKADAIRFIDHFKITKAQFNKIFYFSDNVKLHAGHKDKEGTLSPLSNILKKYIEKIIL